MKGTQCPMGPHQEWVVEFKYLGIIIAQNNTFGRALDHLCQQSKRAQAVLDLHIHMHIQLTTL